MGKKFGLGGTNVASRNTNSRNLQQLVHVQIFNDDLHNWPSVPSISMQRTEKIEVNAFKIDIELIN
jgi:hypothetical protein